MFGYGFGPPIAQPPIFGPPVPRFIHWECVVCDVGWKSREPVCWSCGSPTFVEEYGSVAALEAAAQARLATIS